MTRELGKEVVAAVRPFLGLASDDLLRTVAERFLECRLEDVREDQLKTLGYWTRIAALRHTSPERAQELEHAILALAEPPTTGAPSGGIAERLRRWRQGT